MSREEISDAYLEYDGCVLMITLLDKVLATHTVYLPYIERSQPLECDNVASILFCLSDNKSEKYCFVKTLVNDERLPTLASHFSVISARISVHSTSRGGNIHTLLSLGIPDLITPATSLAQCVSLAKGSIRLTLARLVIRHSREEVGGKRTARHTKVTLRAQ